jgi:hypothetical protein
MFAVATGQDVDGLAHRLADVKGFFERLSDEQINDATAAAFREDLTDVYWMMVNLEGTYSPYATDGDQPRAEPAVAGILRTFANWRYSIAELMGQPQITDVASVPAALTRLRRQFLSSRNVVQVPLTKVAAKENRVLIEVLARHGGRDADALITRANDVLLIWYPVLERSTPSGFGLDSAALAVKYIYDALVEFATFKAPEGDQKWIVAQDLMSYLKDTNILISSTAADVDDVIALDIINGASETELHRRVTVRLQVEEFGLKHRLFDSFLFVKRAGTGDDAKAEVVNNPDGDTIQTRTPKPFDYRPTPGVSFGWVYQPRGYQVMNGKRKAALLDIAAEFAKPGFGINVSFPSFGTIVTSYDTTPSQEGNNQTRVVTVTEDENTLDVAAGIYLSMFDNAVTFTTGWNLTSGSGRDRRYFGLGFSFINLARRISSAVSQP